MSTKGLFGSYAAVGAGAALVGWSAAEVCGVRRGLVGGYFGAAVTCGLIGGAIGAGLCLADGLAGAGWSGRASRAVAGLLVGGLVAMIGASLGHALPDAALGGLTLTWVCLGAGAGGAEGLFDRSPRILACESATASVSALIGGLMFSLLYRYTATFWEVGARASGWLLVGACVGAGTGLCRAVMAEGWLTVVEGCGVGRSIYLRAPGLFLGRSRAAALSFAWSGDDRVDLRHARVVRGAGGEFVLEDLHSRHGTQLNMNRVFAPAPLRDGDLIRLGGHAIRFNRRLPRATTIPAAVVQTPAATPAPCAPTKPVPLTPTTTRPIAPPAAPAPKPAPVPAPNPTPAPKPAPAFQPASPPKPAPVKPTVLPSRPAAATVPQTRPCPQCGRPVPGPRPHCMVCDLSF